MVNNEQLIREANRYVRLKALQQVVPSLTIRKKQPYIDHLLEENPGKLLNLVEFWKINRYRNLFLFRFSMQNPPSGNIINDKLNGLMAGSRADEPIYEVRRTNYDSDLNDVYVFLKLRSIKKHFKSEDYVAPYPPIELDHRKPYYINAIYHANDKVLECRTFSQKKAENVSRFFVNNVFTEEGANCEQIIISNEQLNQISQNSKCTELNINGEYYGAHQIIIKGPDTLRCLNELESKGIGFRDTEGLEIFECKSEVEEFYIRTNSGNGVIQILKIVDETLDPYRYIKNIVGI